MSFGPGSFSIGAVIGKFSTTTRIRPAGSENIGTHQVQAMDADNPTAAWIKEIDLIN
jgi:glycerol-3-phosphate acyltransferase PlsY